MPIESGLAIIVPALNEGPALARAMQALAPFRARGALVLLCDGGSTDGSIDAAAPFVDRVVAAARGRASQMNAGLAMVQAQAYVLLHADTALPEEADKQIISALATEGPAWGRFTVQLRSQRRALRVVEWSMNLRSRLTGICTGDQTLFMNHAMREATGGFAPIALMEDIEFSARARRLAWPQVLAEKVSTSARRWQKHGVWPTVFGMWRLRWAYFFGAPPPQLAQRYGYDVRVAARAHIAVLAKAPQAGLAKTRLIPALGAVGAARAARAMLLHTLARCQAWPTTLWCAPHQEARFFRAVHKRLAIALQSQGEGDIGERMWRAARTHFASCPSTPLLIVGTDCPAMTPAHLQHAEHALLDHDVVLIPAEDGGYVLIGLRAAHGALFTGVDWSTERVMEQTCAILRAEGLSYALLACLWDVDTPADYERAQQCCN